VRPAAESMSGWAPESGWSGRLNRRTSKCLGAGRVVQRMSVTAYTLGNTVTPNSIEYTEDSQEIGSIKRIKRIKRIRPHDVTAIAAVLNGKITHPTHRR
jgi:hypothetical protein